MPTFESAKEPKRVLITGGMGFIGSHLSEALLAQGHQVTVIDNLSTGRFDNIQHLVAQPRFSYIVDDITHGAVLNRLVGECDLVYHLASAVGVKLIVENPLQSIETIVMGTEAVLKAALEHRVQVLIASTSEVYGKGTRIPFAEDDDVVLGPTRNSRWSYAASKMVDEFMGLAYFRQKGLPVVIFRLFNTVGPRQTGQYGMVIPRFVQAALQGKPLTVYGDGEQSRSFLHVKDAVKGIMGLADCPEAVGQVFNVGSTEQVTILELAHKVLHSVDPSYIPCGNGQHPTSDNGQIVFVPYTEAYAEGFEDMRRRVPDISKIRLYTGWEPQHVLEEILRDVIAYMAPGMVTQLAMEKIAVAA